MRLRWILLLLVGLIISPVLAQEHYPLFAWEQGNLALRYPAAWGEPVVMQDNQRWILIFAPQSDAESTEADLLIRLSFFGTGEAAPDLNDLLADELRDLALQPTQPLSVDLPPGDVTVMYGNTRSGEIYGKGWIQAIPGANAVLIMAGRAPVERQREFEAAFRIITESLTQGMESTPPVPGSGALWLTQSSFADGISAFVAPAGLARMQNGSLVLVDALAGLVMLDAVSGSVTSVTPFPDPAQPSGVAVAPDGSVYVADVLCACVRRWHNNQWSFYSQGFGPGAPRGIAVAGDGTLYATDVTAEGRVSVRSIQGTEDSRLTLDSAILTQPLLAADSTGQILVLTDDGSVWQLNGTEFTSPVTLQLDLSLMQFTAFAVDEDGNFIIATPRDGIVLVSPAGQEISHPGQPALSMPPLPGEFLNPTGIAAGQDGILYAADAGGDFGSVTALSNLALPGQIGEERLHSGVAVQGLLDETRSNQLWTFEAVRGDVLNLRALSLQPGILDVALCLYDPSGEEIACVDNFEITEDVAQMMPELIPLNLTDPQLTDVRLNQNGLYFVLVRRVLSFGTYQLGLSLRQHIEVETGVPLVLYGTLSNAIPVQQLAFTGRGGDEVTITLLSQGGTLDPTLILRNARGDVLVRNDNAEDATLGGNAQIVKFRLPSGGEYIVDAMSFSGSGRYSLEITLNS